MNLILIDKNNYKEAIDLQRKVFPNEDGTINILASLDRDLFIKLSGLDYIDDHIKYYLAEKDNEYVGITGIYNYGDDVENAWIGWFGILPNYRNRGLGRELLNDTIELARSKNFKYIRLYTDYVDNYEAIKLYESLGFVGEKYTIEELPFDCRIYSKSLTNDEVKLWNNKNLFLAHQSELDQMDEARTKEIVRKYDEVFMDHFKIVTDYDTNTEPYELNNPELRIGARGLVFNSDNKIAILNKSKKNEYKLVGGGVENGEDPKIGFYREVLEEAGCKVQIDEFIGTIKEERTHHNFIQVSYVYKAHVLEDMHHLNLTEKEMAEGAKLLWLDIDEAMNKIKECESNLKASAYEDLYMTKFVVKRDYSILEYYKNNFMNK